MKISVKLERDVLILKLDGERSFSEQKKDIEKHLLGMKSFLANGNVKFTYDGQGLTFEEEIELCNIADMAFDNEVEFMHKQVPPHHVMRHVMCGNERIARKFTGTVKAGETVESNGDLIIIGDVNPTAEITARGDIYVIGNLRGVAHAGFPGDNKAMVYAMGMNPVMIKIADLIGFNPGMSQNNSNGVAIVENGEIKIKLL